MRKTETTHNAPPPRPPLSLPPSPLTPQSKTRCSAAGASAPPRTRRRRRQRAGSLCEGEREKGGGQAVDQHHQAQPRRSACVLLSLPPPSLTYQVGHVQRHPPVPRQEEGPGGRHLARFLGGLMRAMGGEGGGEGRHRTARCVCGERRGWPASRRGRGRLPERTKKWGVEDNQKKKTATQATTPSALSPPSAGRDTPLSQCSVSCCHVPPRATEG